MALLAVIAGVPAAAYAGNGYATIQVRVRSSHSPVNTYPVALFGGLLIKPLLFLSGRHALWLCHCCVPPAVKEKAPCAPYHTHGASLALLAVSS